MARRFVAGDTLDDAVRAIRELPPDSACSARWTTWASRVTDPAMARQAAADYVAALDRMAQEGLATHVSVKLTQLGLDLDRDLCLENVRRILSQGAAGGQLRAHRHGGLALHRAHSGDLPRAAGRI